MNTEKAIKEINSRIELANKDYPGLVPEYIQALEMAIEALRKQEPKKLEVDGEFDLLCAGCGSVLDFKGYDGDYCPNCGQRLDWED